MVKSPARPGRLVFGAAMTAAGFALAAFALPLWPGAAGVHALAVRQAETDRVVLALASSQLHGAVLSGAPFANELALVKALGGAHPDIAPHLAFLEPAQKTGIASLRRIVGDFEQIAARVLIEESTSPDANWFGQTMGRVSALSVAVMMEARVNPFKSQVAPAIKDMQVALAEGDFPRALSQLESLPESARGAFAAWRALVQIRMDAIAAANRVAMRANAWSAP